MQLRHIPSTGPRYWAALSVASVFGANLGDFVAKILHLGHVSGLPWLALILAVTFLAEARMRVATTAFYWVAICTMRTAATNIGDLSRHELGITFLPDLAGLAVLLVGVLVAAHFLSRDSQRAARARVPGTDAWYWGAMLVAGTLGTVMGDFVADYVGLGDVGSALVLSALLAVVFLARGPGGLIASWFYWVSVVAIRAAGTSVGDALAGRHGLDLGLGLCTLLCGLGLVALLLLWPEDAAPSSPTLVPANASANE